MGYNSINTSVSGLKAAQKIMDAATNNIANASTPGYKRLEAKPYEVGLAIQQMVDEYQPSSVDVKVDSLNLPWIDRRYNSALSDLASSTAQKEIFDQISSTTTNQSLADSYVSFMNAASALQVSPNDAVLQTQFDQAGKSFVNGLNSLKNDFKNITNDVKQRIQFYQTELDSLTAQKLQQEVGNASDRKQTTTNVYLSQVISQTTGTLTGHKEVFSGILPSVTKEFDKISQETVSSINSSYGKILISENADGELVWNYQKGGSVSGLLGVKNGFVPEMASLSVKVASSQRAIGDRVGSDIQSMESSAKEYDSTYGVDLVAESMKIKKAQQMYEANAKVIEAQNQMIQTIINISA